MRGLTGQERDDTAAFANAAEGPRLKTSPTFIRQSCSTRSETRPISI
jgi:hypothetical protein